jgi:type IV secretory pathway VirB2 component (pilin)
MTNAIPAEGRKAGDNFLLYAAVVIIVGFFATTLSQPQVLARLPLQNLLKNGLHESRAANAAFFFWAGLPWYFKPMVGVFTDAFPLFGSRRRRYLIYSTLLAVASWVGLYFTPHVYGDLLWVCIVINVFMIVASTVLGGYMVEIARETAGSGRLTALRQAVQQFCTVLQGPAAGFLASIAFGWTAASCGGVMFLMAPVAFFFLRERKVTIDSAALLDAAGRQLDNIFKARTMWAAAGLLALFYIAPGFSTALFYKQQDELHMTTQGQGTLTLIAGVAGIAASVAYGWVCWRLSLRTLIVICIALGAAASLGYLYYSSIPRAQMIEAINGVCACLAELSLMDLAVRATPAGSEGLGYSLMMSVRNLALFGTDWLGSNLLDKFHLHFNELVVINAATTALAIPFVFLLPKVLVWKKDAELYEEAPMPRTALME